MTRSNWLTEARRFIPTADSKSAELEKHDIFTHPKYGDMTRRETQAMVSRGPNAVPEIRASHDVHGKNGNVDWMALHRTATAFGYRTRSIAKGVRAYEHPQLRHSLKIFYNDPSNDAWAFTAGRHRDSHKKGGRACQIGYSNEDLGTYLAQVHTAHAEGGQHPELCQYTDPHTRMHVESVTSFGRLVSSVLEASHHRRNVGDARLHVQHTRWYAARPRHTAHPLQQHDQYHAQYGYGYGGQ